MLLVWMIQVVIKDLCILFIPEFVLVQQQLCQSLKQVEVNYMNPHRLCELAHIPGPKSDKREQGLC